MPLDTTAPAVDPDLQKLVDKMNAAAGYPKAVIHRGELMKPAERDMPLWPAAYDQAVKAAFAVCRPSTEFKSGPRIGDWFGVSRPVLAKSLPKSIGIGVGKTYSADYKRSFPKQHFQMVRLPLARFWHPSWRPIINQAIIDSGGP